MKKTICDRCGVEFGYQHYLDFTPKGKKFERFILEHGGDYCRKCIVEMVDEIQTILDKTEARK